VENAQTLRQQAREIWQAGVDAVASETLIEKSVSVAGDVLQVCDVEISLAAVRKIAVVGAGKAGAGMAAALESVFGPGLLESKVTGWINVPDDCVRSLQKIHLHGARPAGWNEPTEAGVAGAEKILDILGELESDDLAIVLLSGGGSALLPAPAEGISLADKQAVTRFLMHAGATIGELNCVRKQISKIKGGKLASATKAGRVLTLIISDVISDPLDVIASGPTVADSSTPADALDVLRKYDEALNAVPKSVIAFLEEKASQAASTQSTVGQVDHFVVGNNSAALEAARQKAAELGYEVRSMGSANAGVARQVGVDLAEMCLEIRVSNSTPVCLLSGGEPIVHVVATDQPRRGGRNQELILAATERFWDADIDQIVLLSGGTDGEDGPTDAAGAYVDSEIRDAAKQQGLQTAEFLAINNSYTFFEQAGGLLKTGPTQTNVMDLRVGLVR